MYQTVRCAASPSLALVKYWGKQDGGINLPATTSIAITLSHIETISQVSAEPESTDGRTSRDEVTVNDELQPAPRFKPFFDAVRSAGGRRSSFRVESRNTFPTGAGLASSSSAFAALALGCTRASGVELDKAGLSRLARIGSGSASRAVYGGFTRFPAGAEIAFPIADEHHWPDLRLVIAVVDSGPKPVSSREAMIRSRDSSPYYRQWVDSSERLAETAEKAILERDLETLGLTMRQSYLRMFSTMFTSNPPVVFWLPESVAIIHLCERLRNDGIPAWETMDAGPQVKVLTTCEYVATVCDRLRRENPTGETLIVGVGSGPRVLGVGTDS